MISALLASIIDMIADLLILIVIVDVIVSYLLSPYHPVRSSLDRIVQPMLAPLRRWIPPVGVLDFTPVVLIILIQVAAYLLRMFLVRF